MAKEIKLEKDAILTLKDLIADIDYEESMEEDCDADLVLESLYKIKEIVARALL